MTTTQSSQGVLASPDAFLVNLSGADSLASAAGYVAIATGAFAAVVLRRNI